MIDDIHRIVNLRIKVQDYHFDAAIDCNWYLHDYHYDKGFEKLAVLIELYNLDKPDWDIKVIKCTAEDIRRYEPTFGLNKNPTAIYDTVVNYENSPMCHTFVSFNFIYDAIIQWIKENT